MTAFGFAILTRGAPVQCDDLYLVAALIIVGLGKRHG